MNKPKYHLAVQINQTESSTQILHLTGREAWALHQLAKAGEAGCTPINQPAPRWAAYVHELRDMGFSIETVTEPHGGTFSGTHARYVLRTPLKILPALEGIGGFHV